MIPEGFPLLDATEGNRDAIGGLISLEREAHNQEN
jgi:hypothetical protein